MIDFFKKGIAVVGALIILVLIFGFVSCNPNIKNASYHEEKPSEPLYILGEYDGKVALYKRDFAMPVEIYDVYLSSLPESERQLLKEGITAQSDEQAQKLIEDYTS